jgi:hypothetical protein
MFRLFPPADQMKRKRKNYERVENLALGRIQLAKLKTDRHKPCQIE